MSLEIRMSQCLFGSQSSGRLQNEQFINQVGCNRIKSKDARGGIAEGRKL